MKCDFIPSPNFSARKEKITAVVIHYTASLNIQGTLSWFLNKSSQVSAHYVIGRDGRVVQMVKDEDVAWHAGKSSLEGKSGVNAFSIGIELVATFDSGFTEPQMHALEQLVLEIVLRYDISLARVVGHADIAPGRKTDPGPLFDWARVRSYLQEAKDAQTVARRVPIAPTSVVVGAGPEPEDRP